jgi:hypothetical protein
MYALKTGSIGVSEMIDHVSFDGIDYQVKTEKETIGTYTDLKYIIKIDDKEKYVKVRLNTEHLGTALEKQAEFAVLHEIKTEIFQHLYNTKVKLQLDKLFELVGKDNSALDKLIENDATFAAYVRNFHPEQYTK